MCAGGRRVLNAGKREPAQKGNLHVKRMLESAVRDATRRALPPRRAAQKPAGKKNAQNDFQSTGKTRWKDCFMREWLTQRG